MLPLGLKPSFGLIPEKLRDRNLKQDHFLKWFDERLQLLSSDTNLPLEYKKEMHRFLSLEQFNNIVDPNNVWSFIVYLIGDLRTRLG